jgi:O-succinylbenzoate synthase
LFNQRSEGRRGLMVAVRKDDLHDAPRIAASPRFDKDTYWKLS